MHTLTNRNRRTADDPNAKADGAYTCPMHPDVRSDTKGACPTCGMDLLGTAGLHAGHEGHERHHEGHGNHANHHEMMARDFKRKFFIALVLSIPVLALSPTIQSWLGYVLDFAGRDLILFLLASVIALYTAWPFYTGASGELKERRLGMMVLVSLAVLSGYLYSVATTFFIDAPDFYWEISTLTLVLLLGHWMEMRAVLGTSGALNELVKLIPPKANRVGADGTTEEVETGALAKGDVILIRPGEKIPIDGEVVKGESSVNEALITGESKPVAKQAGDAVIGGSLNVDGSLTVRVMKTGAETAVAQIVELVKNAQSSKPKTQRQADRAAHYLTLIAIIIGVLTFFSWNFLFGATFVFALTLTITVVVITCPHALGLAIPTVTTITSTLAAKNGILIKDMVGFESIRDVGAVLFDKTGTLTAGEFGVSDAVAFSGTEDDLLAMTASVEQHSEHVIARAIVAAAKQRGRTLAEPKEFSAIPGKGVRGSLRGVRVLAGTRRLMEEQGVAVSDAQRERAAALEAQGKTVIYVGDEERVLGLIALADTIKATSKPAIEQLKAVGVTVAMLTGDNRETAKAVAGELGLDTFFAEVLPEDKVNAVKKLQSEGRRVMMVGDGVNDAPALTQADVGVAIGAGTDVAIESADVVLVKNEPLDIVKLMNLNRETMRKMKQNLWWATGYNVVAIPLAAGVLAPIGFTLRPEWGAIAMTLSSIIVVINALMLRRTTLVAA